MINVSTVAFKARMVFCSSGVACSHTQVLELVASALGYGTYAALKLDRDVDPEAMFVEADFVVLNQAGLRKWTRKLGLDASHTPAIGKVLVDTLDQSVGQGEKVCRFYSTIEDFQDFIFEDVQARAFESDEVGSAYAATNAAIDEFYTDDYEFEPLIEAEEEWTLVASGSHTGEIDQDRPYSGHAGHFTATYSFRKEGRCGLIETGLEFGLDFDRDYE